MIKKLKILKSFKNFTVKTSETCINIEKVYSKNENY
jgi:hypothetical protein